MFDAIHSILTLRPISKKGADKHSVPMAFGFHNTIFGRVFAACQNEGLCVLVFADGDEAETQAEWAQKWPHGAFYHQPEASAPYVQAAFSDAAQNIPLVLIGTDFQLRVWQALVDLTQEECASYSALAAAIGQPSSARAVGNALGQNPLAVVIPCHRILSTQGMLNGYHWGIERKRALLKWEGRFKDATPSA